MIVNFFCDIQVCGEFIDNNLENLVRFWGVDCRLKDLQALLVK
jgi:hypothetical protein